MLFVKFLPAVAAAFVATMALGGDVRPLTEKQVLGSLEISHHAALAMGELALEKAVAADLKQFARHLINEHEAADAELHALAEARGIDLDALIAADPALKGEKLACDEKLATLKTLRGTEFEKKFLKINIAAHKKLAQKLKLSEASITIDDLRAHIEKLVPKIEMHAEHAEGLLVDRM